MDHYHYYYYIGDHFYSRQEINGYLEIYINIYMLIIRDHFHPPTTHVEQILLNDGRLYIQSHHTNLYPHNSLRGRTTKPVAPAPSLLPVLKPACPGSVTIAPRVLIKEET